MNSSKYNQAVISDLKGENGKATAQLEVAGVKRMIQISYQEEVSNIVVNLPAPPKNQERTADSAFYQENPRHHYFYQNRGHPISQQ
jgi:hypothetical protein